MPYLKISPKSVKNLDQWEAEKEALLRGHWDLYSSEAYERRKIADQLRTALLEAAVPSYEFSGWQRQVRYKYSLTPLSPQGSLVEPGGRFNIPDMHSDQIRPLPALYVAENKETALQEALQTALISSLSALELALIHKESLTLVSVCGKLERVIDLHSPERLKPFLKLTRGMYSVRRLLEPNWRAWCMQFDIPAPCQVFGQLAANAGISAILYPSKFTKKSCLAIYPQNLEGDTYVAIEGEAPAEAVSRLGSKKFQKN